jgi:hypothetical protein
MLISSPPSNSIIVVDVKTGNILSARKYASNGAYNYKANIKSMLISSGNQNSYYAYVLSNLRPTGGPTSCTGQ